MRAAAVALGVVLAVAPAVVAQDATVSVREVSVARDGDAVAVRVTTSGRPRWRTQALADPFRVVVDLDGATYRLPETPTTALVEPVREIRGSQFRKGVVRVVIVLEGRADFSVEPDERGLRVVFTRAVAARPEPSPSGPAPAPAGAARGLVYGIVMREERSFAYLWDPATRQTGVYKVGDAFAGGVVETIEERRVVIRGADGTIELKLDDPKPDAPTPPKKN